MERVCCIVQYEGTNYSGFQIQANSNRTIQEKIEKALTKMHKGKPMKIIASGRTDAGVHAYGQVFHFDSDLHIPEYNWKKGMQTLLPSDIQITEVHKVSMDFHSRYDTKQKEYRYRVLNTKDKDVFKRNVTYHVPYELDIERIKEACRYIEGTHDFTSFSSTKTRVRGERVRTVYDAICEQHGDEILFIFRGDGFLYNMVRILVGTLIQIGRGVRLPEDIPVIMDAKDRTKAGITAPPQGLFLWRVEYKDQG